jgi:hypothetical protein
MLNTARMVRIAVGGFLTIAAAALPACVGDAAGSAFSAQAGREPDYRRIIAEKFLLNRNPDPILDADRFIVNRQTLGPLEIAKPRWVQHDTAGWVWLVCLRAHPPGKPAFDLSVFISDRPIPGVANPPIADARTSILADGCDRQAYEPFKPGPPSRQ